jgi:hypothetical protein
MVASTYVMAQPNPKEAEAIAQGAFIPIGQLALPKSAA